MNCGGRDESGKNFNAGYEAIFGKREPIAIRQQQDATAQQPEIVQEQGGGATAEPRRFNSPADAEAWASQHYGEWVASLTPEERGAIEGYKMGGSAAVNQRLRGQPIADVAWIDRADELSPYLNDALARTRVPEAILIHRHMSVDTLQQLFGPNFSDLGSLTGVIGRDQGFHSGSLLQRVALDRYASAGGGVLAEITVPVGTKAGYLDLVRNRGEFELALRSETLFRVTSVRTDAAGRSVIAMTVHRQF